MSAEDDKDNKPTETTAPVAEADTTEVERDVDDPPKSKSTKTELTPDQSTTTILNQSLLQWTEELWGGEDSPKEKVEEITVSRLTGRNKTQVGDPILRLSWDVEKPRPSRTETVRTANKMQRRMQEITDNLRKEATFLVEALNDARGGRFDSTVVTAVPKLGLIRRGGGLDGEDDVIDPLGGDILRERTRTVLEDGRFYAELTGELVRGTVKELRDEARESKRMVSELFAANMALARQNNEAQNNKAEREFALEERRLMLSMKQKGFGLLAGMLPDFLKKVTDGKVDVPGGRTAESMAMEAIMDEKTGGLTSDQKHLIFGDWTDNGERLAPGILSAGQVQILVGILNEKVPVETLDRLITEGSDEQLTVTQYSQIMEVLKEDADKLVPLVNILKSRKADLDKRLQAAG